MAIKDPEYGRGGKMSSIKENNRIIHLNSRCKRYDHCFSVPDRGHNGHSSTALITLDASTAGNAW